MSTTTSINITTIRDNEKKQKSITYINPLTSSQELIDFAQSIVAVTNDSYDKTTRIDRIDCDNANQRTVSLFQYQTDNTNWINVPSDGVLNITTAQHVGNKFTFRIRMEDMNMAPTLTLSSNLETASFSDISFQYNSPNFYGSSKNQAIFGFYYNNQVEPQIITCKIFFPATANYDAFEKTVTFNITEP